MISREDIQKLAELSRLELSEEELKNLEEEFPKILDYVGAVSKAAGGEAPEELPKVRTVMREDTPRPADAAFADKREALLAAAPRREGDYIVVRKVLEKE